ncbi:uncharacterized protein bcl2l12 isoform X1 [Alosa sapidissima]|uniref:uncharacterized protein bcl2l12 isoform X1 n=1 Tax=Alosa sapidissima TaxID=34773 RepID=UPI001C082D76|nr:uncharacterized protein bcl2l12 isoform X1 [Alosa sapidissima]XP_041941117.1 uncharacterized protein bcl2l12 isoform X1 [Alosa sapidissima]
MSEGAARPSSPSPSVSLLEVKADTQLVLKSFLRNALSVPAAERPGRVGGTYRDSNKYSASSKSQKTADNGWDSWDEAISSAEEKKHSIKTLIKTRLRPRTLQRPEAPRKSETLEKDRKPVQSKNDQPATHSETLQKKPEQEDVGSSPSSPEDEEEKKQGEDGNKKKTKSKRKMQFSSIFSMKSFKSKPKSDDPKRPSTLVVSPDPPTSQEPLSPSHPPEFYEDVADTLERIARQSVKKKPKPVPLSLSPPPSQPAVSANAKNDVVQQLVQMLCTEGDIMNDKINANPFLRTSLDRLSYPSFAKLLDAYASQTLPPATPPPVPASPTLRKVALTMEASRRVLTATGARQHLKEHAERYMENFAPWIKNQGGWEHIVEEIHEYD